MRLIDFNWKKEIKSKYGYDRLKFDWEKKGKKESLGLKSKVCLENIFEFCIFEFFWNLIISN